MPETLADVIAKDRERLNQEREAIFTAQQELEQKLAAINNEMRAIDAYEAAKTGKAIPIRGTATRRSTGTRRGSKRDDLLKVIREGNGLSRGEILEKMGLKGNKQGEMSVSNALTALTKGNQVRREDGKYLIA